ncbi:MAG: hypothetical protein WA131_09040 [Desulfitobacteriaceae bacterium]
MMKLETKTLTYESLLVKAPTIRGFDLLNPANQAMFIGFLKNFYSGWEHPEKHQIKKVGLIADKANGVYLRVDCSKGEWYHVKNSGTWY